MVDEKNVAAAGGEVSDGNQSGGEIKIVQEFINQQDPLAPHPEIVNNVIEAIKRAQRGFQETFYKTPPAVDPTV